MLSLFLAAALVQTAPDTVFPAPAPVETEPVDLPIAQQTALRCAVAIALATERQRLDKAQDQNWPDLLANQRGREFFVRSFAKLMDDTGLSREDLALRGHKEAEQLASEDDRLDAIMPACLLMLDASGL